MASRGPCPSNCVSARFRPRFSGVPARADVRPVAQTSPLGIKVRDLDATTADHLRIPENVHGVLVSDVDSGRPRAVRAGAPESGADLELNRRPISSASQYIAAVDNRKRGDIAALLLT